MKPINLMFYTPLLWLKILIALLLNVDLLYYWILASDWERVIRWPGYWPLIGRESRLLLISYYWRDPHYSLSMHLLKPNSTLYSGFRCVHHYRQDSKHPIVASLLKDPRVWQNRKLDVDLTIQIWIYLQSMIKSLGTLDNYQIT